MMDKDDSESAEQTSTVAVAAKRTNPIISEEPKKEKVSNGWSSDEPEQKDAVRVRAKVKWFDVKKGYGFVTYNDMDVFVLQSEVVNVLGTVGLEEGLDVECEAKLDDKGRMRAYAVTLPDMKPIYGKSKLVSVTGASHAIHFLPHTNEHLRQGRFRGVAKFFNDQRGFGFIAPVDRTNDIFVHRSDIVSCYTAPITLREGENVEFDVAYDHMRLKAVMVTGPGDTPVVGKGLSQPSGPLSRISLPMLTQLNPVTMFQEQGQQSNHQYTIAQRPVLATSISENVISNQNMPMKMIPNLQHPYAPAHAATLPTPTQAHQPSTVVPQDQKHQYYAPSQVYYQQIQAYAPNPYIIVHQQPQYVVTNVQHPQDAALRDDVAQIVVSNANPTV